jgi:hypothetical protein
LQTVSSTLGFAAFWQQAPKMRTGPPAIAPTSSRLSHWLSYGRATAQRLGRANMKSKLTKLATAGFLSLWAAAPALAGSVTQPGETVGLNVGAPLPPGWYAINTVDWGCRKHQPAAHMYGSHHSGRRVVNAVDVLGREIPVAGGVARGGSRRATRPRPRFARHLL